MTAGECIVKADLLRPNAIGEGEKLEWCLELEAQLKHEFYPRYAQEARQGETEGTVLLSDRARQQKPSLCLREETPAGRHTVLSGSGPYEAMYVYYVACKIDLAGQETDAYAVDAAMLRAAMDDFRKDYHRSHMPL